MHTTQRRSLWTITGIASLMFVLSFVFVKPAIAAGPADLTVTTVLAPSSASLSSTIKVIHVTMNISSNPCASTSTKFYLCTNGTATANTQRGSQSVPALLGGGSVQMTNLTFTIPSNAKLGTNYIIVVCGFGITDSNWSNNTNNTTKINITP
jgi:hypothetical protein